MSHDPGLYPCLSLTFWTQGRYDRERPGSWYVGKKGDSLGGCLGCAMDEVGNTGSGEWPAAALPPVPASDLTSVSLSFALSKIRDVYLCHLDSSENYLGSYRRIA